MQLINNSVVRLDLKQRCMHAPTFCTHLQYTVRSPPCVHYARGSSSLNGQHSVPSPTVRTTIHNWIVPAWQAASAQGIHIHYHFVETLDITSLAVFMQYAVQYASGKATCSVREGSRPQVLGRQPPSAKYSSYLCSPCTVTNSSHWRLDAVAEFLPSILHSNNSRKLTLQLLTCWCCNCHIPTNMLIMYWASFPAVAANLLLFF